ncbi:hypothetical protein K6119_00470 [Paracrocinitomix mangrovi]|uniref:hypothetical protein n=1 Tax=Paracrocinitomix mangrovi TaxID=2862509 RepID=UPI001C8D9AD7|nr:hypothetical protein [Paracrocinitomix mangrovi]UKN01988.1 hypothetical protein K6119_00470 [Paracrocinitomix mangrovi]
MRPIIFLLFLGLFTQCDFENENVDSLRIPDSTETVQNTDTVNSELTSFIPEGYEILAFEKGDLNQDNLDDYLLALNQVEEDTVMNIDNGPARPLLILLRNQQNTLNELYRNDSIIYCYGCGGIFGDPFAGMEITDKGFIVYHYGGSAWRWTHDLFFSFQKENKNYQLDSIQSASFHAGDIDSTYELNTDYQKDIGTIYFDQFNVYKQN